MNLKFGDADQRARACRTLLGTAGLESLWTDTGPTQAARDLIAANGAPLSPGRRAMLLAAWAFWTGDGQLPLGYVLAASNVEAICSLCIAATAAPEAIDAWLTRTSFGPALTDATNLHTQAAALFDEARAVFSELDDEVFDVRNPADACALGALQMYRFVMGCVRLELGENPIVDNDEAVTATNEVLAFLALQENEIAEGRDPDGAVPESR